MTDDKLKRVAVIVGAGVPAHMLARLHDAGMMLMTQDSSSPTGYDVQHIEPAEFYAEQPVNMDPAERERILDRYAPDFTEMGGMRMGKTEAMLCSIKAQLGMLDHAEPDYIYDGMGFRHVRPPARREIQFIDTPKPMTRRKARRQRAQRKAKP